MRNRARQGNPSDRPIFILGMMRSGSTLVEQILASHHDVYAAGQYPRSPYDYVASFVARNAPAGVPRDQVAIVETISGLGGYVV